eukprot:TRINITY_DN4846_c0_g1_i2.p1 TRINITY_DN4846_c0_g1~~TRINITY_DN4846_c0_g1_i2.p1  ORF type:complete len:1048 (+),score=278.43 TRINITY_DN4846_c0_g1_i2:180-3323(+)
MYAVEKHAGDHDLEVAAVDCLHALEIADDDIEDRRWRMQRPLSLQRLSTLTTQDDVAWVVALLKQRPEDAEIVTAVCMALYTAHSLENALVVHKAGGIELICQALRDHANVEEVQSAGCAALQRAALLDVNKTAIERNGGIELLFHAMRTYPSNTDLQARACGTLWNMAVSEVYKVQVADGGVALVVAAMRAHKHDVRVQQNGCGALFHMSAGSTDNKTAILKAGGLQVLTIAMSEHASTQGLQELGCWALASLTNNQDAKPILARLNGIFLLCSALRTFPNSESLQRPACTSLANLASHTLDLRRQIEKAGGIALICGALQKFEKVAAIQIDGLQALIELSTGCKENVVVLKNAAGLQRAIAAMQSHSGDAGVQRAALSVLAHLADDVGVASTIVQQHVPVLFNAMRVFLADATVQKAGCECIKHICAHKALKTAMANNGSLDAIYYAMRQHVSDADVNRWGCSALWEIAIDNDGEMRIMQTGGLNAIYGTIVNHVNHAMAMRCACGALACVSYNQAHRQHIGQSGGINHLHNVLRALPLQPTVVIEALRALKVLAAHPLNAQHMVNSGTIDLVLWLMDINSAEEPIKKEADEVLRKLMPETAITARKQAMEAQKYQQKLQQDMLAGAVIRAHSNSVTGGATAAISCAYFKECTDFLATLQIAPAMFDPARDTCFCAACHAQRGGELIVESGKPQRKYALPVGWARIGVAVPARAEALKIWEEWNVAYAGIDPQALQTTLEHGSLLMPGDALMDGRKLPMRPGAASDQTALFTSPTIQYAQLAIYARAQQFKGKHVKVVLQLRQKPGTFTVQAETVNWRAIKGDVRLDSDFAQNEVEWKTTSRSANIVVGVCVIVSATPFDELPIQAMVTAPPEPVVNKAISIWNKTYVHGSLVIKDARICHVPRQGNGTALVHPEIRTGSYTVRIKCVALSPDKADRAVGVFLASTAADAVNAFVGCTPTSWALSCSNGIISNSKVVKKTGTWGVNDTIAVTVDISRQQIVFRVNNKPVGDPLVVPEVCYGCVVGCTAYSPNDVFQLCTAVQATD